jgi:pentatricopeptide repeat protein
MIRDGLKPDVVCYTTLIDAYKRIRNYDKCWELFEHYREYMSQTKGPDEFMLSYMIRICAFTHDSEKAIRLFNELESNGFVEYAAPYNSLTKRYAE